MAINVKFYTFSKKVNSTARPSSGAVVAEFSNVLIKSGSGVVSPVLSIATKENVSTWNYCYISDWSRYYFIKEWTWDNGQWLAYLAIDVMATYKNQIGGSTQYVTRAAKSTVQNGDIVDTAYPTKSNVYRVETTSSSGGFNYGYSASDRRYVVGILNSDSSAQIGGVSYYAMTSAELGRLKSVLLNSMDYMGVAPGDQVLAKTEVNPFQYVVSCKCFPFEVYCPSVNTAIQLGWWTPVYAGNYITGGRIGSTAQTIQNVIDVTKHPQASSRGAFLNYAPYSKYSLIWGPFGEIELDPVAMRNATSLDCRVYGDYVSGNGHLKVWADASDGTSLLCGEADATVGVEVRMGQVSMEVNNYAPLAQREEDIKSPMLSQIPVMGGVVSAGYSTAMAMNKYEQIDMRSTHPTQAVQLRTSYDMIGAAYGFNKVTGVSGGGQGSFAAFQAHSQATLFCTFTYLTDEDNTNYGRPVCSIQTIGNLSGYVKCAHAELPLNATETEQSMVINQMEGGFFYE